MLAADRLLAQYESVRTVATALGPAWLADLRAEGFRRFNEAGVPTTRDEEFRYLPLQELVDTDWKPAYGANLSREEIATGPLGAVEAATVVFVNGQSAPELMTPGELPDGVYVGSLEDLPEGLDVSAILGNVNRLDGKLGSTNDERFRHLNDAHLAEAAIVYVPARVEVQGTILVRHILAANEGAMAVYPRTLIVLEEGARAAVVESYEGISGRTLDIPVTEIVLRERANLSHTRVILEGAESAHIAHVVVEQARESVYDAIGANLGGRKIRNDINVDVRGEHSETWLNGVSVGGGNQILDNHTRLDHAVPNCASFEVYKSVLKDEAQGVFNGKIFVYEDAQKTDAKQTNAAMLLSARAGMNAKPQLEIFADDVKCTHGATIGQLREDALFYLRARGIPKPQAEALLVYAFAAEVLARVPDEGLREGLERAIFEKLDQ